jgi:TrmH family RNA methyltransferase
LPHDSASNDHPVVLTKTELQRLRSLREKKNREAQGLFVIEGAKVVDELIAGGFSFIEVYATPAWVAQKSGQPRLPAETRLVEITAGEMERASHFPTPSPVLAIGRLSRPPLPAGALDHGLTLALDGVQDAGNVGTLLRIADWFAFDRVVLSAECADVFHQKVINASMGSFARVITHQCDLAAALSAVTASTPIIGCDLVGTEVYTMHPARDAIVVIGSEGKGLSAAVAARISQRVTIPRFGKAESLNAAVAAGIVCAQLRRP